MQIKAVSKITQITQAKAREKRLQNAMKELKEYADEKDLNRIKNKKKKLSKEERAKIRVSRTDSEARILLMPDNGYRPAYNVQFGVDTDSQVVVGVDVSKSGNDGSLMLPMFEKIKTTYNTVPERYLVDSGFKNINSIIKMSESGCKVYTPTKNSKNAKTKMVDTKKHTDQEILDWLARMGTEEGNKIYRRRASSVECVNAHMRNRGLYSFLVRGLSKVKNIALMMAVAHNMMRTIAHGVV